MTIRIDTIGSHGKARILSYGHDYEIPVPTIRDGFRKAEYHYDEKLGLIHEPYPLSKEELAEEAAKIEATPERQIEILKERIDELERRTAVAIEPK